MPLYERLEAVGVFSIRRSTSGIPIVVGILRVALDADSVAGYGIASIKLRAIAVELSIQKSTRSNSWSYSLLSYICLTEPFIWEKHLFSTKRAIFMAISHKVAIDNFTLA